MSRQGKSSASVLPTFAARQSADLLLRPVNQQIAAFAILSVGGIGTVLDIGQEVAAFGKLLAQGIFRRQVADDADEEMLFGRFHLTDAEVRREKLAILAQALDFAPDAR